MCFFFNKKSLARLSPTRYLPRMAILNQGNSKTRKGEKFGYKTFGIHLAPASLSGYNVCQWASNGCTDACLNTSGRGAMSSVQKARINKTLRFFKDKQGFMSDLFKEVRKAIRKAEKANQIPVFRLNLTSDIPWEKVKFNGQTVFEAFPTVQWYDYTKSVQRMEKFLAGEFPANYHLTFSRSESNDALVQSVMKSGGNVAVVFRKTLPATWNGAPVVDGDETDLRFLDGAGVVVGLVAKGKAKGETSGFVVESVA